jgi:hypothetical protein
MLKAFPICSKWSEANSMPGMQPSVDETRGLSLGIRVLLRHAKGSSKMQRKQLERVRETLWVWNDWRQH